MSSYVICIWKIGGYNCEEISHYFRQHSVLCLIDSVLLHSCGSILQQIHPIFICVFVLLVWQWLTKKYKSIIWYTILLEVSKMLGYYDWLTTNNSILIMNDHTLNLPSVPFRCCGCNPLYLSLLKMSSSSPPQPQYLKLMQR